VICQKLSTVKVITNTGYVHTFLRREKCSKCLPSLFVYSVKLFLKLLLLGPEENCPISFLVQHSIQKLFGALDKGFKITSCVTRQM